MQQPPLESHSSTSKKTDWIAVATIVFSAASFLVGALAIYFSVKAVIEKGNADLVQIGVNVLRAEPEKGKDISAAREWALDLIDANAGGVKFSPEARAQLQKEPLQYPSYVEGIDYYGFTPDKPAPRRQPVESLK